MLNAATLTVLLRAEGLLDGVMDGREGWAYFGAGINVAATLNPGYAELKALIEGLCSLGLSRRGFVIAGSGIVVLDVYTKKSGYYMNFKNASGGSECSLDLKDDSLSQCFKLSGWGYSNQTVQSVITLTGCMRHIIEISKPIRTPKGSKVSPWKQ
jgi:hypothetical protein